MTFDEVYRSRLKELGQKILGWIQMGKLTKLAQSQVEILNTIYYTMKNEIKDAPEKVKKDIWEEAKKVRSHMNKKDKIKYAKAVYTLTELEKQEKTGRWEISQDSGKTWIELKQEKKIYDK